MKSPYVVAVGDIVADLLVTVPSLPIRADDFQIAEQIQVEAGGNANFLIMAARLGVGSIALGALGEDAWGEQVAAILREEAIDASHLAIQGTTTLALVLIDQTGEHAFVGKFGQGQDIALSGDTRRVVTEAGAVFASGYSLREARYTQFTLDTLMVAQESGVPTFLDTGPAFAELAEELQARALKHTDYLLLTEEELATLSHGNETDLLTQGPKVVVVKQGADGCRLITSEGEGFQLPGFKVPVVDTTAAGDCFDAAFVAATVWDWPLLERAKLANAVGAAKVQKLGGGRNAPTLVEIKRIIEQFEVAIEL